LLVPYITWAQCSRCAVRCLSMQAEQAQTKHRRNMAEKIR
jgi:hypothetical protein